jgi:hypothetical protein
VQRIIKEKERGKYMKREPGKCLELFLRSGKHCIRVSRRKSKRNKRRGKRRRSIHKMKDKILKVSITCRRVYC